MFLTCFVALLDNLLSVHNVEVVCNKDFMSVLISFIGVVSLLYIAQIIVNLSCIVSVGRLSVYDN